MTRCCTENVCRRLTQLSVIPLALSFWPGSGFLPLHYLKSGWRHEGLSKGVEQWIARHNYYSTNEVDLILRLRNELLLWRDMVNSDPIVRRRVFKCLGARLPFRPLMRFLYIYLFKRGFMDGAPSLLYSLLRVAHDIYIIVKIAERRNSNQPRQ